MLKTFWTWLSKTKNQKTLAWIGAGIVAAALAYKQVFPKQAPPIAVQPPVAHPAPAPAPLPVPSQPVQASVSVQQKATSGDGGVSVNASGNASVVIGK